MQRVADRGGLSAAAEWEIGEVLGKGMSGEVRVAVRRQDERKFALKVVDVQSLVDVFRSFDISAKTLEANLRKEINVMRRLHHRNIVHLETFFWEEERLYMCMELVEGKDLLRSIPPGGLGEERAKDYFFQLCSAVAFCHSNNVIHGDLKPENILIRERDGRLKLIDFGFSHIVTPGERLEVIGGTVLYSPPDDAEMTFAFDDWSCGVILFAMLTCSLPFPENELIRKRNLTIKIPENIPSDVVEIFVGFFNPDPSGRTSVCDVLASSRWLESERGKELPETASTLALARQMSRPHQNVKKVPTLPMIREPSQMPLVENGKDVKILGRFLQKLKGGTRSKAKIDSPGEAVASQSTRKTPDIGYKKSRRNTLGRSAAPQLASFLLRSDKKSPPKLPESIIEKSGSESPVLAKAQRPRSELSSQKDLIELTSTSSTSEGSSSLNSPITPNVHRSPLCGESSAVELPDMDHFDPVSSKQLDTVKKIKSDMSDAPITSERSPPFDSKTPSMLRQFKKFPAPINSGPKNRGDSRFKRSFTEFGGESPVDIRSESHHKQKVCQSSTLISQSFDEVSFDVSHVEKLKRSPPLKKERAGKRLSANADMIHRIAKSSDSLEDVRSPDRSKSDLKKKCEIGFVLDQLKSFAESEKKLVESLTSLIDFKAAAVQSAILSESDAEKVVPELLKEIRSIHQSIYSTVQNFIEGVDALPRHMITLTNVGCILEAVLSILASDRTASRYLMYSKEYEGSVNVTHSLRKRGVNLTTLHLDFSQIYHKTRLPLIRLNEYGYDFASVFEDLDEPTRKSVVTTMKAVDKLCRKCQTNTISSLYF